MKEEGKKERLSIVRISSFRPLIIRIGIPFENRMRSYANKAQ